MRFFFYILFFGFLAFIASKFLQLLISGKLFDEGAIKESFRESGKTLWLGMRLFVILWLLYLIFIWIVRQS